MPIAKYTDQNEQNDVTTDPSPKVRPEVMDVLSLDSRDCNLDNIINAIDGSPWSVDYYSQMLGPDQETSFLDSHLDPTLQQYTKIVGMIFNVQDDLSMSTNEDGTTVLTGTSSIPNIVPPNIGDPFTATLDQGKLGLFKITEVERKTFSSKSRYDITYEFMDFLGDSSAYDEDLANKTSKTFIFDAALLRTSGEPLVREEDWKSRRELEGDMISLMRLYVEYFKDRDTNSILVPGATRLYDDYHLEFVMNLFGIIDQSLVEGITRLTSSVRRDKSVNILDMLADRHVSHVHLLNKKVGIFSKDVKNMYLPGSSIYYTNVQKVIRMNNSSIDAIAPGFSNISMPATDLGTITATYDGSDIPVIHPVTQDDFYIFTEAFYDNTVDEVSILEKLTRDFLNRDQLNSGLLSEVYRRYKDWPDLERFYYGPILVLLAKYSLNNASNAPWRYGATYV